MSVADEGFEYIVKEPAVPDAPARRYIELVNESSRVREHITAAVLPIEEEFRKLIVSNAYSEAELIFQENVLLSVFDTDRSLRNLKEMFETGILDLWVYENEFPVAFAIIDQTVLLGAQQPEELLIIEADAFREEWAESYFEYFREDAVPFATWLADHPSAKQNWESV